MLVGVCASVAQSDEGLVPVRARVFDIQYRINEEAFPLESVHVWYTLDRGKTWHDSGPDEDRQSPITFEAPEEGLYGFLLVATNRTGPSSYAPHEATTPHLWAQVDATPPVVQLHRPRLATVLGRRVIQVRWSALDAHFAPRPITIEYQRLPDDDWRPVTPDPLANTGRFDWRVPRDLHGAVAVRVTATDRVGHRVSGSAHVIELPRDEPARAAPAALRPLSPADELSDPRGPTLHGSARAQERARKLFAAAVAHRERGEYREAVTRLREVVTLNPYWARGFAEMGDVLYRLGDMDRAVGAYELALRREPTMRAALRGAAMVHRQRKNYSEAAAQLRTILRYNPNDAEVWMNLGDIAVFQGDEVLAQECYLRATRIDPDATQVMVDARKRLALMAEASRNTAPGQR